MEIVFQVQVYRWANFSNLIFFFFVAEPKMNDERRQWFGKVWLDKCNLFLLHGRESGCNRGKKLLYRNRQFLCSMFYCLAISRSRSKKFDVECNTQFGITKIGNIYSICAHTFIQTRTYLSMSIAYVSKNGVREEEEGKAHMSQRPSTALFVVFVIFNMKTPQNNNNNRSATEHHHH